MESLWSKINEKIPYYFEFISQKYGLDHIKISDLKTAIVGNGFAIIIAIGRFHVDVFYAARIDGKNQVLNCGSFFAEKYTYEDRQNLLEAEGAENIILNNLKVIASGLESKWEVVLQGDVKWIEDYRKSQWYSVVNLTQDENKVLWQLI